MERSSSRRNNQCIRYSSCISINIQVREAARVQGARWGVWGGGRAEAVAPKGGWGVVVSVEQAARPPLPSQLLVPRPFSLSTRVATGSGPHSLRSRWSWRAAGAETQARRVGGEETRRRTGAAGCTRKVGHGHQQRETGIGVSYGGTLPSHGCLEPSAAGQPDSCAGQQRPRWSLSSSPPVLLRKAPSPHPSPAPLPVAARADEDSASTPVGGEGALGAPWRRRRPRAGTGPCTRRSRRHCSGATKGHP